MPLTLCLARRPKSLNAKPSAAYREALRQAASAQIEGAMMHGPLYSRVIWFHRSTAPQGDVDNILKPIHDALKGTVYLDDAGITRAAVFRVDISRDYVIESDPAHPDGSFELLRQIDVPENNDILYIEIGSPRDQYVLLGPVL